MFESKARKLCYICSCVSTVMCSQIKVIDSYAASLDVAGQRALSLIRNGVLQLLKSSLDSVRQFDSPPLIDTVHVSVRHAASLCSPCEENIIRWTVRLAVNVYPQLVTLQCDTVNTLFYKIKNTPTLSIPYYHPS